MSNSTFLFLCLLRFFAAIILLSLTSPAARAATPAQVDAAMKKAVDALYAAQKDGNWEGWVPQTNPHWTGLTAISTYALLSAGENEKDKRVATAIDFLVNNPSKGVYASGVRCLVWSRIKLTPAMHVAAQKDVTFLLKSVKSAGEARGLFYYTPPSGPTDATYDHSASQIAALGLSVMVAEGFDIPRQFWELTEKSWQNHQFPDGAWAYTQVQGPHAASMTAAAVATLFITQSILNDPSATHENVVDPHIEKGIAWLGTNFDATFDRARETSGAPIEAYALFAISRVGVASGNRFFGAVDWYQRGADYLIATQLPDGNWPASPFAPTPLGLLFLAYGSSPVAVNKLQYTTHEANGKPVERWNERPRDLLNFVEWMGQQLEHRLNWQVVNLSSSVRALHDAPILVISGSLPLSFSDEERATLRKFVEDGGMIVGNANNDSAAFSRDFLELGKQIFAAYDFRELPLTHPIFASEQYRAAKFKRPMRVQGLSNGVRELMLLPRADLSNAFQRRGNATQADFYHLFDDIVLYSMDTSGLARKGSSYLVLDDPKAPIAGTIKLARLQYDGNWNPEPGGWRRLAAVFHNTQKIALDVEPILLGSGKLSQPPAETGTPHWRPTLVEIRQTATKRITAEQFQATGGDPVKIQALVDANVKAVNAELDAAEAKRLAALATYKLAHLTGTEALKLTDAQRQDLKKFVDAGGTLVIDAAGGSTEFAASVEQMLRDTFGSAAAGIESPLPLDSPIYQQPGRAVDQVQYRQFARTRVSKATMPQLRGIQLNGRLAIIYSREDLSAGLVGEPVDGITGYAPASATELMSDIILFATLKPSPAK